MIKSDSDTAKKKAASRKAVSSNTAAARKKGSAAAPRAVKTATTGVQDPILGEPTHEEISRRAYEIYLGRGGTHGSADQDWIRAERELRAERARAMKMVRVRTPKRNDA